MLELLKLGKQTASTAATYETLRAHRLEQQEFHSADSRCRGCCCYEAQAIGCGVCRVTPSEFHHLLDESLKSPRPPPPHSVDTTSRLDGHAGRKRRHEGPTGRYSDAR